MAFLSISDQLILHTQHLKYKKQTFTCIQYTSSLNFLNADVGFSLKNAHTHTHTNIYIYIYIYPILQNNVVQSTIRYYHHSHIKMIHSHHNQVPTAPKEDYPTYEHVWFMGTASLRNKIVEPLPATRDRKSVV